MAEGTKYRLKLQMSAKDLVRSLNPVCKVTLVGDTDRELLRTGPIPQSQAPIWLEHLRLGIRLWDTRLLRVDIYDNEGTQGVIIASTRVSLGWLMRHERGDIGMQPGGILGLMSEIVPENDSKSLYLKLSARELRQMDLVGNNDPYFTLSSSTVLYTSEVLDNDLTPHWKPIRLPLSSDIASNPLHLDVYDKDLIGSDYIGGIATSLLELTEGGPELRIRDKAGVESGIIRVEVGKVTTEGEFIREIRAGRTFEVCFGVDLGWGSSSFHAESGPSNPYYKAISSIALALEPYTDDSYTLYGFGGRLNDQDESQTHWSLSSTPILGSESLLNAYFHSLSQAIHPTPRKPLSPLLQEFRQKVQKHSGRYYLLIVLSAGHFSDLEICKEELRLLSALPASLLLVGIGDISRREAASLDSNSALLRCPGGTALRDCMSFSSFPSDNFPSGLLQSLPVHLQDYLCLAT